MNTAHTFIASRKVGSSFKLSNRSMPFCPGMLPGRWISLRSPTQQLDVPRTKVTRVLTHAYFWWTKYLRNEGFESLTFDEKTQTLYTMLQSATIQDGGDSKSTSRFTRLFAYNVGNPVLKPRLVGEWVVPLPQSSKGNTQACSEIHFVSPGIFLALSRDGDGRGGGDTKSSYKWAFRFRFYWNITLKSANRQADLFSIASATDIHGSKFDNPANPIAVGGVLDSSITPAKYVSFVNYIDPVQLARFGLHNGRESVISLVLPDLMTSKGKPDDQTLIDSKWESLALAPVDDPAFPNDYFLFTVVSPRYCYQGFFIMKTYIQTPFFPVWQRFPQHPRRCWWSAVQRWSGCRQPVPRFPFNAPECGQGKRGTRYWYLKYAVCYIPFWERFCYS